jgi:hypothetical protein
MVASVSDCITHALSAFDALATVAEPITDEWQYLADLDTVWRARLRAVEASRGAQPAPTAAEAAIVALVEEAGRITDPHRAIDWLSTLPQVALAALGEPA